MQVEFARSEKPLVGVLGGTGFVGHHLLSLLVEAGYRVRVATRRRERHRDLMVLPDVELVEADIHHPPALRQVLSGCHAVINLTGILNEHRPGDFRQVHVELPRKILQACEDLQISRLLHMSALNAAPRGPSEYLRSKGEGEKLVHAIEDIAVTSFRPAVIFGPGDHFFQRFATLLRMAPVFFFLPCPRVRLAPVYVGDVAAAMVATLDQRECYGQSYELCGPHVYTLEQLVTYTANTLKLPRVIVGMGDGVARLQARILQHLPGKAFSLDNLLTLQTDCTCHGGFPALFAHEALAVEAVVPAYLLNRSQRGRLDLYRHHAHHEY